MKINKRDFAIKIFIIFLTIITLIICYENYNKLQNNLINNLKTMKYMVSWFGIIIYGIIIYTWYIKTRNVISTYTIFMTFFFLFNFGQCILWALGIHTDKEIGEKPLYTLGITDNASIIKTQLLVIVSMISFHLGAIFCFKGIKNKKINLANRQKEEMYKVNKILAIIIIPVTFINVIHKFLISKNYGYSALYYGEYANSGNSILILISKMFLPCLMGLLIGSGYNKKVMIRVYSIYIIYAVTLLLCGDRGEWIYGLVIFLWLHHNYVKKFNMKRVFIYGIIGLFILNFIYAVVAIRNSGINIENLLNQLSISKNPLIEAVTEMGSSMGVSIALVQNGFPKSPYGNTYFFSILGMITERVINLLGIEYIGVSTWFSENYLKINYGAGFSIIAEALLNFGPYLLSIVLFILGYIISSFIYIDESIMKTNSYKTLFSAISTLSWIPITRGTMQYCLKDYFYTVILYFIIYNIILNILKIKRHLKNDTEGKYIDDKV